MQHRRRRLALVIASLALVILTACGRVENAACSLFDYGVEIQADLNELLALDPALVAQSGTPENAAALDAIDSLEATGAEGQDALDTAADDVGPVIEAAFQAALDATAAGAANLRAAVESGDPAAVTSAMGDVQVAANAIDAFMTALGDSRLECGDAAAPSTTEGSSASALASASASASATTPPSDTPTPSPSATESPTLEPTPSPTPSPTPTPHAVAEPHAVADSHRDPNANSDSDADSDPHAFADTGANADGHFEPDANREPDSIALAERDREPIGGALAVAERRIRRSGARAGPVARGPGPRRGCRRSDLRLVPEPRRADRRRRRDGRGTAAGGPATGRSATTPAAYPGLSGR